MISRRSFLKMNMAIPVALTFGPQAFALGDVDQQYADFLFVESSGDVPAVAMAPETKVVQFRGDPIDLWTEHCLSALLQGSPIFAGVTSVWVAFSLSEMARDYGYRLESRSNTGNAEQRPLFELGKTISGTLDYVELNSPNYLHWVLAKSGIEFRGHG